MMAIRAAFVVAVVVVGCSRESAQPAAKQQQPAVTAKPPTKQLSEPPRPKELKQVTIKALGMYCEDSCPLKVRYALADVTSVYQLGFDISNESIFVSYDASLGPPKEVTKPMIAAIKKTGFDPWLAKEEWPADAKVQVVLR